MSPLRLAGRGVECAEDAARDGSINCCERLGMGRGELEVCMMANVIRW